MLNNAGRTFIGSLSIAKNKGFDPLIVLAHAWHESAGFTRIIGQNNYWGIKTPADHTKWPGLQVERFTHEFEPVRTGETADQALARLIRKYGIVNIRVEKQVGKDWYVGLPQRFRDWSTAAEAIDWYCDFIQRVYPLAYSSRTIAADYFTGLVCGKLKYATDPKYAAATTKLYAQLADSKIL
jgi:flagellum-specific peptidoglycan hydrolase FlgJ